MTCHLINKAVTIITIGIITFKIFFDPVTQFPGNEKNTLCNTKSTKIKLE